MAVGTIVMIVCLVLIGLVEIVFKKDLDKTDKKYSVYEDSVAKGLDGLSNVAGMTTKDLDT